MGMLISPGGCMIGHDWNIFEDVNNAVTKYATERNKEIKLLDGNLWYINY